ncbi:DNA mismatch repair protein MutS, partial [Myxococcota bacterium]|nr:DNA mismatch repair protein MutS [Myxococcota bacterium]
MSGEPTPLMQQFLREKERYPDAILLFRVGDFYEMFYDDAVVASEALGLVLTSRDKNRENPIPLCGVPYHALKTYMGRLLDQGFKVAVCEQVEDPKTAKGVVRREVTQVVSPGLILDEDQLDAKISNYTAAVIPTQDEASFGFALADISTGEFKAAHLKSYDEVASELARIRPRQILADTRTRDVLEGIMGPGSMLWELSDPGVSSLQKASELLATALADLPAEELSEPVVTMACAAVIVALKSARPAEPLPRVRIVPYTPTDFMVLDEATICNLELFETIRDRRRDGTLVSVLDQTVTAMGGRMLRSFILYPLMDISSIEARLDGVERMLHEAESRDVLRKALRELPDFERLASRILHRVATPRDLGVLGRGLSQVPNVASVLMGFHAHDEAPISFLHLGEDLLTDVADLLGTTLVDEPPVYLKDGGVIRAGVNPELDELLDLTSGGKRKILEIEEREREATRIATLKVKFNRVFGYYIEIPRSRLEQVPDYYIRKQTLANAERYVTEELAEHEAKVLAADERRIALEERLFLELRERIAEAGDRLKAIARSVALLDALASLAEVAHRRGYVRPKIDRSDTLTLKNARHPVIESMLRPGEFIPNDIRLSASAKQLAIITGPNMSGKSTIIRQVALNVLMGQMGSFVPASAATFGICDRIFSRVGASDNIARGESTFMVEMKETANILAYATRRSLVILDEIGRGTSTYDGVSIAWSVVEHIHDVI